MRPPSSVNLSRESTHVSPAITRNLPARKGWREGEPARDGAGAGDGERERGRDANIG